MSFFAELKRRNVLRAAMLYVGAAWALAQGIAQLSPAIGLPDGSTRWFLVAATIGFPFAMAFSWVYEWISQGIVKESAVEPGVSITHRTARKLDLAIIGVLSIAVVLLVTDRFASRHENADSGQASVAVLPFENLSDDKANAYFAEGIQDEILTRLAKIGTLKVISRTSTLRYASRPDNLPEIAKQLGVDNILEGSVQKSGDAVHINVQLIRAAGDSHVWAESYDRKLDNVFGVESEVATAIADALDAKLSPAEKTELARQPTANADAWQAYLHGLSLFDRPDLASSDLIAAAKAFEQAVQLDPQFAVAWAQLSTVDAGLVFTESDTSAARRDAAKSALAQAVHLQPDAFETRRAQAYYAYFIDRDYDGARAIFEQIRRRAPSDAEIPRALALIARRQNRWADSMRLFDEALAVDPRNPKVLMWAADNRIAFRQFPEALRLLDRVTDIVPGDTGALSREAAIVTAMGDLARAQAIVARMGPGHGPDATNFARFYLLRVQHKVPEGMELARRILAETDVEDMLNRSGDLFSLAEVQRLGGDAVGAKTSYEAARDLLEKAMRGQPDTPSLLDAMALTEAGLGDREAALAAARRAVALLPTSKDAISGPTHEEVLVRVQARFGDRDEAIAGVQRLLAIPYQGFYGTGLTPALLRLDPDFDNLRADPRFQKLASAPLTPLKPSAVP